MISGERASVDISIANLFDFETRVEMVKCALSIVHAILTILGEKLTYNKKV